MYNLYSVKRKKNAWVIVTVLICIGIVSVTAILVYNALFTPLPEKEVTPGGEPVAALPLSEDIKYDKNTVYLLTETYLCGHQEHTEGTIPESFRGKTINEIKKENPSLQFNAYNDFSISAEKLINKVCDNHYMITLSKESLISYKKSEPGKIVKISPVNTREFSEEDMEILKSGIEVGSFDEMLEFFEDFAN